MVLKGVGEQRQGMPKNPFTDREKDVKRPELLKDDDTALTGGWSSLEEKMNAEVDATAKAAKGRASFVAATKELLEAIKKAQEEEE